MRWRSGRFECAQCGAALAVAPDALPAVVIVGTGPEHRLRILILRGEEIHRCEIVDRDDAEVPVPPQYVVQPATHAGFRPRAT